VTSPLSTVHAWPRTRGGPSCSHWGTRTTRQPQSDVGTPAAWHHLLLLLLLLLLLSQQQQQKNYAAQAVLGALLPLLWPLLWSLLLLLLLLLL